MLDSSRANGRPSSKFDGSLAYGAEEIFRADLFGRVAKLVWRKPDAAIAAIAGVSDRAARDYLSGRVAAPGIVLAALMVALARRR